MPFKIRKVRNAEKYRLTIKDDNDSIVLTEIFINREGALEKVREQIEKLVEEKKQQDVINNNDNDTLGLSDKSDTEIEDV